MTTIVEIPIKFNTNTKKILDSKEEFYIEIKRSQFVTYTLEHFTNCFIEDKIFLKAIDVKLYSFQNSHRPESIHYAITWEDVPQKDGESWDDFKVKVDRQLRNFLADLKSNVNAIEGTIS